jgi:peptide/nickel transport system permease protein
MLRLILSRLLLSCVVVLVVSIGAFALARYAPGDPVAAMVGEDVHLHSVEDQSRIRRELGLDDPLAVQYGRWLRGAVHGDLGYSLIYKEPVATLIGKRLPATVLLLGSALAIALVAGAALGAMSAAAAGKPLDRTAMAGALLLYSVPPAWLALVLVSLFAVALGWLPSGGLTSLGTLDAGSWADRAWHMVLPIATLASTNLAVFARYQRSTLLDALRRPHVTVARAKGLSRAAVVVRHGWRNALIPMATLLGSSLATVVEGAYVVETIFSWPGLGRLGVDAIVRRDYPVVMGVALVSAVAVVAGNWLADVSYGWLDPRLRRAGGGGAA